MLAPPIARSFTCGCCVPVPCQVDKQRTAAHESIFHGMFGGELGVPVERAGSFQPVEGEDAGPRP